MYLTTSNFFLDVNWNLWFSFVRHRIPDRLLKIRFEESLILYFIFNYRILKLFLLRINIDFLKLFYIFQRLCITVTIFCIICIYIYLWTDFLTQTLAFPLPAGFTSWNIRAGFETIIVPKGIQILKYWCNRNVSSGVWKKKKKN